MLIKINATNDVIDDLQKLRSKIIRIWFFRSVMSGILTGLILFIVLHIISHTLIELNFAYFSLIFVPMIIVLTFRFNSLKRNYSYIPEFIDDQLNSKGAVLTSLDMHNKNQEDSPFFKFLTNNASISIKNKQFIKYKVIESPIEFILIVFLALISIVLNVIMINKDNTDEQTFSNQKLVSELVEIEAFARINDDKDILNLISETKNKILNNEITSLSNLFANLENELIERDKENQETKVFIEKLKDSNEDVDEIKKLAFEYAQKQLMQKNSRLNIKESENILIHLNLDELLELLQKGVIQDKELNEKIQAFIKNNSFVKDPSVANKENSNSTSKDTSDLWIYKKFNPAKVEIVTTNEATNIIDYHAVTEKYTSQKHSTLRKRIIAELSNND